MSAITTHVLDTSRAARRAACWWCWRSATAAATGRSGRGTADGDGRQKGLLPPGERPLKGCYRLTFHTGAYFAALGCESFYPTVSILFEIRDPAQHHHVPLLLSPLRLPHACVGSRRWCWRN